MDYSRYLMIALVPFFAAALMPWVAPDAVDRVLVVTLGWTAAIIFFMAGFSVGDVHANKAAKARLSVLSAMGCCIMVMLACGAYGLVSPLLALALIALAFFFAAKLLQTTQLWQSLSGQKMALYGRFIWVVLGCLLMLFLSYYRQRIVG